MIRCTLIISLLFSCAVAVAQELFVFTEPASLMPAKAVTIKLGALYPDSRYNKSFMQRYIPEVMVGVSKKIMLHVSSTFSGYYSPSIRYESTKLYGQWRFFANDNVHTHFRMAAFAEGAYTRSPFLYEELNLDGDQSGLQGGLIATQLLSKFALSATTSFTKALEKSSQHTGNYEHATEAINYSLSAGYLLFPRNYTSFRQLNLNVYVEMIGMKGLQQQDMLDLAPALQLIVNSRYKFNAGYRFQVRGNMLRSGEKTLYLGLETTFLGALQKKQTDTR